LIAKCNKLKAQYGLVPPTSEEVATDMVKKFSQEDIEQKLKDRKIEAAAPRKEEQFVVNKKKGGKKPKTSN